ncbi:PIN domain-containing protein [Larkinella sp. VNQ87]|uniref:PIN domain-containing protein n=1 Tax=Larkinella sp. VNQ87 TaxID=3400921 RepID=UPI003C0035D8
MNDLLFDSSVWINFFRNSKNPQLEADPYRMADKAAGLYRSLRQSGTTVRKPNDCLIAAYAIHFNLKLVHNDIDFDRIVTHLPVPEGVLRVWFP